MRDHLGSSLPLFIYCPVEPSQRSCTGLGVKPQDMTALSIDYVITLTGGAPRGGRCHTNVNTIEKLCKVLLFFLFLLNKSNT